MTHPSAQIILMDNGSVKAPSTLQLRRLAHALSEVCGLAVDAVSLRHADRIKASELAGKPAQTLVPYLSQRLSDGGRRFLLVPLFFAASRALIDYLPDQLPGLKQQFGEFELTLTNVLYPLPQGEPLLVDLMLQQLDQMTPPLVAGEQLVLVDHGSPDVQVTAVRQHLAQQLRQRLGKKYLLEEAVMERRSGAEYDFNGALLADLMSEKARQGVQHITLLMQFLLPGRHAGKAGDVIKICQAVQQQYPALSIRQTPLVTCHPLLIDILQARLQACMQQQSCLARWTGSNWRLAKQL